MSICTLILALLAPDLAPTAPQACAAIVRESRAAGVSATLMLAIAHGESRLSMTARSPGGHVGPLQVSPVVLRKYGGPKRDPVRAGVRYFGALAAKHGEDLGICHYQGWRDCRRGSRGMKRAAQIVRRAREFREAR